MKGSTLTILLAMLVAQNLNRLAVLCRTKDGLVLQEERLGPQKVHWLLEDHGLLFREEAGHETMGVVRSMDR